MRLGDIVEQANETWDQDSTRFSSEFPYIEISAVGLGTDDYTVNMVPVKEAPSRARMIVRAGDIIVSTTRPHRGAIARIRPEDDGVIASTGFVVLRSMKTSGVSKDFLLNILMSSVALRQFLQRSSGGNYPAITPDEIGNILIPIPKEDVQKDLLEQCKKAQVDRKTKLAQVDALLDSIDDLVLAELGLAVPKGDERFVYAVHLSEVKARCDADYNSPRFSELRKAIDKGKHRVDSVAALCKRIDNGFAAGRQDQAEDETDGIPHIRPLNITGHGQLTFEGTKFVPRASVKTGGMLAKGEVLFNNTNSTAWVGKSTVFPGGRDCTCSNHITRLVVDESQVLPKYLAALFNALRGLGLFGLLSTNFNNQAGINTKTLRELRIPVPSLPLQRKVIAEVAQRYADADSLRAEAVALWTKALEDFENKLLVKEAWP